MPSEPCAVCKRNTQVRWGYRDFPEVPLCKVCQYQLALPSAKENRQLAKRIAELRKQLGFYVARGNDPQAWHPCRDGWTPLSLADCPYDCQEVMRALLG